MKKAAKSKSRNGRKTHQTRAKEQSPHCPWKDKDYAHGDDKANGITTHLLNTMSEKLINHLLHQIKDEWSLVSTEFLPGHFDGVGLEYPYNADDCAGHALDWLVYKSVFWLVNDHALDRFDLLAMKVINADLFVLKYVDTGMIVSDEKDREEEMLVGIALRLVCQEKDKKDRITIFPKVGPHFAIDWLKAEKLNSIGNDFDHE